ncbi:M13 family metallopeptidase [Aerococcaceae bacterium NML171108]|nr:M13 family metallopeptidase [Aerococcaceae bacterium NML171108]
MKTHLTKIFGIILLLSSIIFSPLGGFAQESRIQDDLYQYVNKTWIEQAELTPDVPIVDNSSDINDEMGAQLHTDLFSMIFGELEVPNEALAQFVTFYRIASDFERREREGAAPIQPYLRQIESIESIADLQKIATTFHVDGIPFPFVFSVDPDLKNSQQHTLYLNAPSLVSVPKDYLAHEEVYDNLLVIYKASRIRILELLGYDNATAIDLVDKAISFDKLLTPYVSTREEATDVMNAYFPHTMAEVSDYSNQFDLKGIAEELLGETVEHLVVSNDAYFQMLDQIVTEDNIESIKAWMLVGFAQSRSKHLTDELRLSEEVYSNALIGVTESYQKEDAAYQLAMTIFSEPIGIYYGKTYFGEEAKQEVTIMTQNVIEAYKERLRQNTWLSEPTKQSAIRKLETMRVMIGYPDYEAVALEDGILLPEDSLFENLMRLHRFAQQASFASLHLPVDKEEWAMAAHEVNAYYDPAGNSIVFPAAFLQAPNYSSEQTISENYGAIGATIGHEITHAFDPSGAKFDAHGNLNNWWTPEDFAAFEAKTKAMIEQWDALEYAGVPINGTLTLTENVADAGGLIVALEALQKHAGSDANLEEFFISWARTWREKATPEYYRNLIATDEHPPSELRANIHAQNLAQFHETFQTKEGDGMYLAPEKRVSVW